ncbi:polysaccharide biosynthesis protein [Oceanobacillus kimchii]|uniref:putative polysaccharide biosynthesis protein n=1 Tax=Oceanobacillus kimchii TaxID=746691 RepID=UPI0021A8D483|nr:polysaccharide biosynthesis protein [Oceanobacillus kimchii]MCT1576580.1 polysaccharide biosynthesis protein [Oceanobacillus kimchii]MCT2134650.1 polysaccharide biosynthesis protein [Oceanobacillus kimchii]
MNTLVKGTLFLTIAAIFSKVLGSVFRIPLQNIAGDEVLGIFSFVYPVYMVALILSVAGIPIAISKLISEARVDKNENRIWFIWNTARILAICFGLISFGFIYIFLDPIAYLLGGESTKFALFIVSLTLLVAPYMAVYRGYFQGYENMAPTAISQVMEQLIRVFCMLGIAYYLVIQQSPAEEIAGWMMIGSVIGAFASLIYLLLLFRRKNQIQTHHKSFTFSNFSSYSKNILRVSIPIAFGTITMAFMNVVDSLTVSFGLRQFGVEPAMISYEYGIYGRGLALVQITTVIASSIVVPLIPYIANKLKGNHKSEISRSLSSIFFYSQLISWPVAIGMAALIIPLNVSLFTDTYGSELIGLLVFSSIFTSLSILSTGILQAINEERKAAIYIFYGVGCKVLLNLLLIPFIGLYGAAVSTFIVYLGILILNLSFIRKQIHFSILIHKSLRIIGVSGITGIVLWFPTSQFAIESWDRLQASLYVIISAIIGLLIYLILVIIFRIMSSEEIYGFVQRIRSLTQTNNTNNGS